eukprot:symbB.v1.2.019754.t1/scaffold1581.1/size110566/4
MHRGGVRLSGAALAPVVLLPSHLSTVRTVAASSRSSRSPPSLWSCLLPSGGVLSASCARSGLCRPRRQSRCPSRQSARYSTGPEARVLKMAAALLDGGFRCLPGTLSRGLCEPYKGCPKRLIVESNSRGKGCSLGQKSERIAFTES